MAQGTIKKLVLEKGFGFITDRGSDLFFHRTGVISGTFDALREGQPVEFEVEQGTGGKGPRAVNVKTV